VGFKPYLKDQLASFSALTLLVDTVKIVRDMTYNVFVGTLNLAQSMLSVCRPLTRSYSMIDYMYVQLLLTARCSSAEQTL